MQNIIVNHKKQLQITYNARKKQRTTIQQTKHNMCTQTIMWCLQNYFKLLVIRGANGKCRLWSATTESGFTKLMIHHVYGIFHLCNLICHPKSSPITQLHPGQWHSFSTKTQHLHLVKLRLGVRLGPYLESFYRKKQAWFSLWSKTANQKDDIKSKRPHSKPDKD